MTNVMLSFVTGEECVFAACGNENHPIRDCLHYNMPGPSDWWNHLMLNHLDDLAKAIEINY